MSYREEDGQVILSMSREDYKRLLTALGGTSCPVPWNRDNHVRFLNRLNEGNPNYRPMK